MSTLTKSYAHFGFINKFFFWILLLSVITIQTSFPQGHLSISNSLEIDDKTFEFEIHIQSTGASFELTSYQCVVGFNQEILNGGTLTFSYIAASSQLSNQPLNQAVENDNGSERLCMASWPGSDIISSTYTRLGRFRIQNSVPFGHYTTGFLWDTVGTQRTMLTGSGFIDITQQFTFFGLDTPMPVELTLFNANFENDFVKLNWETATEMNVWGFEIQRKIFSSSNNEEWNKIGFVNGAGTSNSYKKYNFQDVNCGKTGKYFYRLKMIDIDGAYSNSDEVEIMVEKPLNYSLLQNYPNPFNPSTKISYSLKNQSNVKLTIYNSIGELVETLVNNNQLAGSYETVWNAMNLSSGIYFYRIGVSSTEGKENFTAVNKMQLVK